MTAGWRLYALLRQLIVGRIGSALATAQVPLLDLAAHQEAIGGKLGSVLSDELTMSMTMDMKPPKGPQMSFVTNMRSKRVGDCP